MLNLLPLPNGYFDPSNNQYNAFNYGVDTFPYHSRTNNTLRLDVVLNNSVRGSYRFIKDREDNISNNVFAPGIGWANNAVPGYISTGSVTPVLGPRLVNETTVGFAHNSYGWFSDDGKYKEDYRAVLPRGGRASSRLASNPSATTAIRRASATTSRMSTRTSRR